MNSESSKVHEKHRNCSLPRTGYSAMVAVAMAVIAADLRFSSSKIVEKTSVFRVPEAKIVEKTSVFRDLERQRVSRESPERLQSVSKANSREK